MLLPLASALVVKAQFAVAAARTKPLLDQVSNLSLILLMLLITAGNAKLESIWPYLERAV